MKGVQCYELFGGIALKNHTFSSTKIVIALDECCHVFTFNYFISVSKRMMLNRDDNSSYDIFLDTYQDTCM